MLKKKDEFRSETAQSHNKGTGGGRESRGIMEAANSAFGWELVAVEGFFLEGNQGGACTV